MQKFKDGESLTQQEHKLIANTSVFLNTHLDKVFY